MKKKKAAIFFDKNDYQLLEIVNDIQERGEASKAFHSLLAEYLHPQGKKDKDKKLLFRSGRIGKG